MNRITHKALGDLLAWDRLAELAAAFGVVRDQGLAAALQLGLLNGSDVDMLLETGLAEQTPEGVTMTPTGQSLAYGLTEWYQQQHRPWDFMRDSLPDLHGKRMLDLGCGEGFLVIRALRQGARLSVGIDPIPEVIQLARAAVEVEPSDRRRRGLILRASADAIPFEDATFDLLTARVAFNYFPLPRPVPEMVRVLAPGGRIYMTVESPYHHLRMFLKRLPAKASLGHLLAIGNAIPTYLGRPVWRYRWLQSARSGGTVSALLPSAVRCWFDKQGCRTVSVEYGRRQSHVPRDQRMAAHGLFLIVIERPR